MATPGLDQLEAKEIQREKERECLAFFLEHNKSINKKKEKNTPDKHYALHYVSFTQFQTLTFRPQQFYDQF